MSLVLGVDAGNTKTIAVVAGTGGDVLGWGRSGCGDIYGAGSAETALSAVDEAVGTALRDAAAQPAELVAGAFSMAGADWPEDYEYLQREMERRGYGRTIEIVNDAIGGLRAGSLDGAGVAIVCGTGIATGARSPDGRVWHSSFWQEQAGSHVLGELALRAVLRADLGIDPPTSLTPRVLEHFGEQSVEDVLHALTARDHRRPASTVRGLARVLLDEAELGDRAARGIVEAQGNMLGEYVLAAARKVGLEGTPFTLVLAGGVLRHPSPLLAQAILVRVRTTSPEVHPVAGHFEPVIGAVLLALEAAGVTVDEGLLARIEVTVPPSSLFVT